jgi:hypothetical protein
MAYTLEQRALAVAEYRLTGCFEHARRPLGCSRSTVRGWALAAESPLTDDEKRMHERADELAAVKRASLETLIERTIELQLRDLPTADFRDRTGLLKIASELNLLGKGKPTAIHEHRDSDPLDAEIAQLVSEEAAKRHGDAARESA